MGPDNMASKAELNMTEGSGIRTAVDVMILNKERTKVLLGQRKSRAGENTWGFPGGHQITGEKISETARRELAEEIGKEATISISNLVVSVRENLIPPWFVPHITIILEGIYQGGSIILTEPDKTVSWEWFDLNGLPEPLFSGIGEIISNYRGGESFVVTDWQEE